MYLPIVISNKIQSDIIDANGYLTLVVYVHYFLPGSLKIKTRWRTVRLGQLGALMGPQIDLDLLSFKTRRSEGERWLPNAEMPYPGYCRAPGTSKCLDVFCNCKALDEQWKKFIEEQKKQGKFTKIQTN